MAGGRSAFGRMERKLARLTDPRFQTLVAQVSGEYAAKQVSDCFEGSRDPYGDPWKPLKRRKGKPLVDTGQLAASISVQPGKGTFKLVAAKEYAAVHQFGGNVSPHSRVGPHVLFTHPKTGKILSPRKAMKMAKARKHTFRARTYSNGITIPARPFFPTKARGIPRLWNRAFKRIFHEEAQRELARP